MSVEEKTGSRYLPLDSFSEHVAANIRAVAGIRGLNASDLARSLGITRPAASMKLRGKRDWSIDDLGKLSDILEVPPSTFIDRFAEWYALRGSNPGPTD